MNKLLLLAMGLFFTSASQSQNFVQDTIIQPTCFNACDGSVVFTTTTTTGPFTAVLTNSASCPNTTVQSSSGNSITISNLCACAANYSVSFYNSSMVLVGFELLQVPITSTAQLILMTPTINPAACSTCCNGSLTVNYSGGYAPSPNNPTVTLDGVDLGTNYNPYPTVCVGQHTLCVKDLANCKVCTTFSMNFVAVAGINEQAPTYQFEIYPNPTSDQVEIRSTDLAIIDAVSILDVAGKEVFTKKLNDTEKNIRIGELKEGVYILQLMNPDGILLGRKKLIKINP